MSVYSNVNFTELFWNLQKMNKMSNCLNQTASYVNLCQENYPTRKCLNIR